MFSPLSARTGFFFFSTFFFFPALSFRSSPLCRVTCFHSLLLLSILLMKCKAHIDFLIMRCRAAAVQHFKDILTGPIWANKSRRLKKKRGGGGGSQYQGGLISWQPHRDLRREQCASDLFIYLFLFWKVKPYVPSSER